MIFGLIWSLYWWNLIFLEWCMWIILHFLAFSFLDEKKHRFHYYKKKFASLFFWIKHLFLFPYFFFFSFNWSYLHFTFFLLVFVEAEIVRKSGWRAFCGLQWVGTSLFVEPVTSMSVEKEIKFALNTRLDSSVSKDVWECVRVHGIKKNMTLMIWKTSLISMNDQTIKRNTYTFNGRNSLPIYSFFYWDILD